MRQIKGLGHLEIPVIRRSRESGNPERSRRWIPAYAGMTGFSRFPLDFLFIASPFAKGGTRGICGTG
ncbi:hypothetical protein C8D83_104128 [Halothiobacillus neapolitanus]|nr:hypothetical protein C8D83_104128 [Halothiobacillus neapolitanus]